MMKLPSLPLTVTSVVPSGRAPVGDDPRLVAHHPPMHGSVGVRSAGRDRDERCGGEQDPLHVDSWELYRAIPANASVGG
jgi:hypothetical protein